MGHDGQPRVFAQRGVPFPSSFTPLTMSLSSSLRALAATALTALIIPCVSVAAQGFTAGPIYAGPRVWLGNLNGATAIGVQAEKGFTQPGKYGSGIIAFGAGVDHYSWDWGYPGGSYEYSVTPIQVFSNYHFKVATQPKLDPYAGLALVYSVVSASYTGIGSTSASNSTTDIAGHVGARYFLSGKFAVQGQVGFGYGTLSLGATWRF